jgi:lysophospholipase L1-like esterase
MLGHVRWASSLVCLSLAAAACTSAAESGEPSSPRSDDVIASPTDPAETHNADANGGAPAPTSAAKPWEPTNVHALANLGDSISQGFDADDSSPIDIGTLKSNPDKIFHDNPQLSWIQGTDARIGSVREHYLTLDPNLVVTPFSRSGSELVRDLEDQAKQIGKANAHPDLVYVLLGGNDICNRDKSTTDDVTATLYPVSQWRDAAVKGLTALVENLPEGATVRFLSMPRVDLLFETLASTRVPIHANTPIGPITATTTCKDLWSITAQEANGICKIVTTELDANRRKQIGNRVDEYNTALAEEVRRFDKDETVNPKHIHFQSDWHGSLDQGNAANSSVGTYKFTPAEVSHLDCFHPSIQGQKDIANHVLTKANWNP